MSVKINRISAEICVVLGCFFVVTFTAIQILSLARDKTNHVKHETWPMNPVTRAQSSQHIPDTKRSRLSTKQARQKLRHKIRMEIIALERAIALMLKETSVTPTESSEIIMNDLYARRVKNIIQTVDKKARWSLNKNFADSRRLRNLISSHSRIPDENIRRSHPELDTKDFHFPASISKFGFPFPFESVLTEQAVANFGAKTTLTNLKHFKDFDAVEENRIKDIVEEARNFGEGNFSSFYEDNFQRVKKEFMEGTELFVDEGSLAKQNGSSQEICALIPESLVGNTTQLILNITLDIKEVIVNNTDVMDGGEWKPSTCLSRHRVAIIIPYRDRWNHLKVLLYYLIPTLKRQQIHFRIFVVEQYGNETFNKGRIMNAAFREALKLFDFHCVTFHDVDLVPEDDRNMYTCTEQPKHMSNSIDKFKYILPYQGLVGGVLMFKREHFQLVNGYSNMYWGWGAEDDDMTTRILSHGLRIYRPPSNIAKYKMVKHDGRKSSEVSIRMRLLRSAAKRSKLEGLNNVKYKLLDTHIQKLFTHFIVDIGKP